MKVNGLWKIKEIEKMEMTDDGLKNTWKTVEEILQDESIDENDWMKEMIPAEFLFDEDYELKIILPLPTECTKEQIEEAVAAGEITLYGENKMIVETHPWKEENGKVFFDSGTKGEVFGEEVSPWQEIPETEDGIQFTFYRLIKE